MIIISVGDSVVEIHSSLCNSIKSFIYLLIILNLQLADGNNRSDRHTTSHLPPPLTHRHRHEPGEAAAAAGAGAHRRQGDGEEEEEGD